MNGLAERSSGPLRARLVECDCEHPGCEDVYALFCVEPRDLWVATVLSSRTEAELTVAAALAAPDTEKLSSGLTVLQALMRRQLLCGVKWSQVRDAAHLDLQIMVWAGAPSWMDELSTGQLLAVRRCVFGRDETRVARALYALDHYYVPDSAHPARVLEQPRMWGVVDHPLAETLARPEDMRDA